MPTLTGTSTPPESVVAMTQQDTTGAPTPDGAFAPGCLIVVEQQGGRAVVRLAGELDLGAADELAAVRPELPTSGAVEIDLRAVRFLDSTGLAALVDLHELLTGRGCTVRVLGPRGVVLRVLDLAAGAGWLPMPLYCPERPDWALVPRPSTPV